MTAKEIKVEMKMCKKQLIKLFAAVMFKKGQNNIDELVEVAKHYHQLKELKKTV